MTLWPKRHSYRTAIPALLVAAGGCGLIASRSVTTADASNNCAARVGNVRPLRVPDGRWLNVEPMAVVADGNEVLVAGVPTTLTRVDPAGHEQLEARDSLLGALIRANGVVTPVYSPIDGRLVRDVRAQRIASRKWLIMFAESMRDSDVTALNARVRMWSGEYDGTRWSNVQEIALIRSAAPAAWKASQFVRHGDTALFAMPYGSGDLDSDVALLRYLNGTWTRERVESRPFAEVALASDRTGALVLATVRGDNTLRRDVNSLFLSRRQPPWRGITRVALGGDQPTNRATFLVSKATSWLVWTAEVHDGHGGRNELRARRLDANSTPVDTTIVVDSAVGRIAVVASPSSPRGYIVATHISGGTSRLRVLATSAAGFATVLDSVNPFPGGVGVAQLDSSRLLIVGRVEAGAGEATLQTRLITVLTSCERTAR